MLSQEDLQNIKTNLWFLIGWIFAELKVIFKAIWRRLMKLRLSVTCEVFILLVGISAFLLIIWPSFVLSGINFEPLHWRWHPEAYYPNGQPEYIQNLDCYPQKCQYNLTERGCELSLLNNPKISCLYNFGTCMDGGPPMDVCYYTPSPLSGTECYLAIDAFYCQFLETWNANAIVWISTGPIAFGLFVCAGISILACNSREFA